MPKSKSSAAVGSLSARAISFRNRHQQYLYGILHEPDPAIARGVCVLLLSPGTKGRVGPHRLYRKIASRLVPIGFHVLRFDFHGLGDSEGEVTEDVLVDMYNSIMGGRYVEDTMAAIDWMVATYGIRHFVGSGLCGGSITALLSAAVDKRIECLLTLGIPTVLDGGPDNWGRFISQGRLKELRRGYLRKLADPQSWRRLLLGKSSYAVIWKALRVGRPTVQRSKTQDAGLPPDNANPRFAPAFLSVLESGRPILLVFSGADRLQHDFREKLEARNKQRIATLQHLYQVKIIDSANHVLSDSEWLSEFTDLAADWLDARYPASPDNPP